MGSGDIRHLLKRSLIGLLTLLSLWIGFNLSAGQGQAKEATITEQLQAESDRTGEIKLKDQPFYAELEDWRQAWESGFLGQVVDTSDVPDWWIGPLNQGTDKRARFKDVKEELSEGLNKIVGLVEGHDRLLAQALQLQEMERIGLKPSGLDAQLRLPEGQAAAVMLDTRWMPQEAIA